MKDLSYCVAIRTLGKAGVKYQQELESLAKQTIPPQKILVYIAEGYAIPKETIGIEEYIYAPKGMVAQRALPFDEVNTEYVLFLDDDVSLAPNSVEKLFEGIIKENADCIAADTFKNQDMSILSKVLAFVTNWVYPRCNDKWAFKIRKSASFSYNNAPDKDFYLSQSAAGPASLWKLSALRRIHFEDELWLDRFGFAYGDDLLYFYKLYVNGGILLVHYKSGIVHLDAETSSDKYNKDSKRLLFRSMITFVLWWRTCYHRNDLKPFDKLIASIAFSLKTIWGSLIHIAYSLIKLSYKPILYYIKGINEGWQFVHSDTYAKVPNFYLSK